MKKKFAIEVFLAFAILLSSLPARGHEARLEAGVFQTISNRFNIPNPGGSRVLVENDSPNFYGRVEGRFRVSESGYVRLMAAPFSASYSFFSREALLFNGAAIPAQSEVSVNYTFTSYRAGYIYRFVESDSFFFEAGIIGKVRQAKIEVSGRAASSAYSNVGFVPLFNVGLGWRIEGPWELRFHMDGAAAKQGRAFDGSLEAFYRLSEGGTGLSTGIRVLEGGADNSKVNTFTLIQYAFLAFTKEF